MPSTKNDDAVRGALCRPCARAADGEFVGANRVLGPEIARAEAVHAPRRAAASRSAVSAGSPASPCSALCSAVRMSRPIGLSPAIGSSVRSRMMTFFLPASALTIAASGNGRKTFGWIEPTFAPRCLAQVVDGRLDVFRGRTERYEHGVRIVGLVLADQAVVAARQLAEVFVGLFEEVQNRLGEIVRAAPPRPACSALGSGPDRAARGSSGRSSCGTRRRFGPKSAFWLSVGQSMMSSGAPRYSRIRSDSCL